MQLLVICEVSSILVFSWRLHGIASLIWALYLAARMAKLNQINFCFSPKSKVIFSFALCQVLQHFYLSFAVFTCKKDSFFLEEKNVYRIVGITCSLIKPSFSFRIFCGDYANNSENPRKRIVGLIVKASINRKIPFSGKAPPIGAIEDSIKLSDLADIN